MQSTQSSFRGCPGFARACRGLRCSSKDGCGHNQARPASQATASSKGHLELLPSCEGSDETWKLINIQATAKYEMSSWTVYLRGRSSWPRSQQTQTKARKASAEEKKRKASTAQRTTQGLHSPKKIARTTPPHNLQVGQPELQVLRGRYALTMGPSPLKPLGLQSYRLRLRVVFKSFGVGPHPQPHMLKLNYRSPQGQVCRLPGP